MAERSSVPNSTTNAPLQESELTQNSTTGIGYGVARPSFSYLNSTDMPSGNSQQSSFGPVSENVMSSSAPPFSYNASNSSGQPLSTTMIVRANGTQEKGATASTPAFQHPAPPTAFTNFNNFAPNNFSNPGSWLPLTPRPTGIASSSASPSNMNAHPSMSTVQHQAVNLYPSPSPPGPWLQPQQIPPFARPPFSPYAPGPYTMPTHAMRPLSAAFPDIQPPGVSPSVSSIGARKSSFDSEQADVPPGTVNSRIASNDETRNETSGREQLDAWTAHRTDTGTIYYYNALTGESTYEKPPSFKGESEKAISQPSPVSWEKLAGTEWTLVTTNDGKRYYYNSRTQISSWQVPSEVTELRKKQDADALKTQSVSATNINIVTEKGSPTVSLSTPAAESGGRDATVLRPLSVSGTSALDLIKRKLQDSGLPASTSPGPADAVALDVNGSKSIEATVKGPQNENKDKNNGDMSDSSSDSEDEDRGPTKEECILQFKEMLKERGVAPFSKWEKELPKIVFDPRFKAIPSHSARRALFEHYVRTRAEEERKEKRAAQKAALEGFKQLLEEAKEDISHDTDYHTFKKKWGDDPRFQTLDRKERESLLNERVLPLKKAAQERAQAERAAAISNFKMMLQEKGDITSSTRWSKVKDSLRSDDRYKSVKHEDREKLFNEYLAELKAAKEEIERKEKAKQDDEDKLKERERALRKRKEREEQEVERVKMKALRKEAIESYQALLVERIKDPQASWTESKTKLEKDPQGRSANPHLDKSDLEKLFREHVKSLYERCVVEFRALLNEVITVEAAAQETEEGKTVISSWSTAKQVLKKDPRYNRVPRKDRESLWHRHADDIQRKQKSMQDQETDGKARSSVDSGKHLSGSKRSYDKR